MRYHLLDHLAEYANVRYVSELTDKNNLSAHKAYILSIDESDYSFEDWKDACEYFLKGSVQITSIKDAKQCIVDWIETK